MPELPEVETMVRGIREAAEGSRVIGVFKCRCACRPIDIQPGWPMIQRRTKGQTIAAVYRRAKRVVLELESGDSFLIEPRMTGLMLLSDPPDREHLRFEWQLMRAGEPRSLWFWDRRGLGTLRLYSREELQRHLGPETLGRDALEMTAENWQEACRKTARPIKVAMLDQKIVAGIGNIYASEILHKAGISPERAARELALDDCRRLALATQAILQRAIEAEGSTLGDGTYRNALNQNGGYQNEHRVYQKHGESCLTCGSGIIERKVLAQRATFSCPFCQPAAPE
jgi:formamidopyrimidine-DNA glycosylase